VAIGRSPQLKVVAEGVSSPEQVQTLLAAGVHVGQGFL